MEESKLLLNYRYLVIGEFNTIYNDIQKIASNFTPQFTRQLETDSFFNGVFTQTMNVYVFTSNEITIRISQNKIDLFVRAMSDNEDDLTLVMNCLDKLGESFKNSKVSRIALNLDFFYQDKDNKINNALCDRLNLLEGSKNAREMLVRQNRVVEINSLSFNDIIIIQNILLQNKNTFETKPGMSLSFDVNTDSESVSSIEIDKLNDLFSKMKKLIIKEKAEIEEKLL